MYRTCLCLTLCSFCCLVTSTDAPCGHNKPLLITNSSTGEILSPNYPEQYPNNADCQWHIIVDDGFIISLTFPEFFVEDE